ncbi:MAG: alkaline phosphatase family protein, partial [Deltaproteobacteria bacterium]|nr:alkaline phosphatase family protein [Deltaproteobacteria bacterium]
MAKMPKKAVVIGLDAASPKRIDEYAQEGLLPNFKKLIDGGVFAENCLVPFPTVTPPNWTTIV